MKGIMEPSKHGRAAAGPIVRGLVVMLFAVLAASCQRPGQRLKPVPPHGDNPAPAGRSPEAYIPQPSAPISTLAAVQAEIPAFAGPDTIGFDRYSDRIDAEAQRILDEQVAWLQRYPATRVTIEGYSDLDTSSHFAFALAERRANAVRRYFLARGVQPSRIQTVAWGRDRLAPGSAPGGSANSNRKARSVIALR